MKAAKNVDRMAGLMDDLDIVTKIEGGSLELDMEAVQPDLAVVDMMDQLEQRAKRNNIEVEFVDENRRRSWSSGTPQRWARS